MIIYVTFPKWFSYIGITLWPFIFIDKRFKGSAILVNHEKIHLRQQIECLILLFYLIYVISYVIQYIKYRNHDDAYRNIVFEREAYKEQLNLTYLHQRKLFAFLHY